jgi:hypothetical protein
LSQEVRGRKGREERRGGDGEERENFQISPPKNCELDTRLSIHPPHHGHASSSEPPSSGSLCFHQLLKTVSNCVLTFPTVESIVPTEVSWRRRA